MYLQYKISFYLHMYLIEDEFCFSHIFFKKDCMNLSINILRILKFNMMLASMVNLILKSGTHFLNLTCTLF